MRMLPRNVCPRIWHADDHNILMKKKSMILKQQYAEIPKSGQDI